MSFVDSHCHLDMLGDADAALARAREAGVATVITIGVDVATSEWAARAAAERPGVWATAGLHPHDARLWTPEVAMRLEALAAQPRVCGVGEAGLDYHYDNSPREDQRRVFREHVRLARRAAKTLVIHCRDAWDDCFAILAEEGAPERVVFHCWTGDAAQARRALDAGTYLSFSGIVTFRNAAAIREAAALAPLDRVLVETDAPFLTPEPHRGAPNEPAHVGVIARAVAAIKGIGEEEAERATAENAARAFGLTPSS